MTTKTINQVSGMIGIIIFIIVIITILWGFFFPGWIGATNGSHTGQVTAVEYRSNIIWDANLVYFKSVRESSQENIYCVNNAEVKKQLTELSKNKKEVVIYYKNNFFMWKWQCNGGESIIYKVEQV